MHKLATLLLVLAVGCSMETPAEEETTVAEQAVKNTTVTKIFVNGLSDTVALLDAAGTNGFLAATQDQIAGTLALDFSWGTPNPAGTVGVIYQGAGEIPAGALTQSASTAHLQLTTPASYEIRRCEVDLVTADFTCAPSGPLTFDLTWVRNGFGSIHETIKRTETLGPVTTKLKAEYLQVTATVNGTWGGRSSPNLAGDITDSQSKTYIREITVAN